MSKLNPNAAEFTPSWLRRPAPQSHPSNDTIQESWDDPVGNDVAEAIDKIEITDRHSGSDNDEFREGEKETGGAQSKGFGVGGGPGDGDGKVDRMASKKGTVKDEKKGGKDGEKMNGLLLGSANVEKSQMGGVSERQKADAKLTKVEVDSFEAVSDTKKVVNIVFIGHVDAGKSTISGHLLYLTGNVDERTMEKYEKEAKALNRESWKYAWALDTSEQERAKGKTEECGRASFQTERRRFIILDAPGHKNFVPHMIGGASQADIGILVISARKGEFETGFERGGQTREHAMLAKTSGVRQLVVVINKLDDPSVINPDGTWSEERFRYCKEKLQPFLKSVGWNPKDVTWIPLSGLTGQNLKNKVSPKVCPWFKKGESLIDTLDHMKPPDRLVHAPVKMPVFDKYREMGTVVMGKLQSGVINVNDKLIMMPNHMEVTVDGMALEGSESAAALPGDHVRLRLKGVEEEDVRPGFVLCSPGNLVNYSKLFDAQLMILEHKSIICAGYSSVIHIHAAVEECTVDKLLAEVSKDQKIVKKYPKFVRPGMRVLARLRLQQAICVEPFKEFAQLGRFMLRDEGKTIAVGIIKKIRDAEGSTSK